ATPKAPVPLAPSVRAAPPLLRQSLQDNGNPAHRAGHCVLLDATTQAEPFLVGPPSGNPRLGTSSPAACPVKRGISTWMHIGVLVSGATRDGRTDMLTFFLPPNPS